MKKFARMIAVLFGVMFLTAPTAFAVKVDAELGKTYELLLSTFVAGDPVDANRVPQGATILLNQPELLAGTYKELKFVQQPKIMGVSIEGEDANTSSLNDVIIGALTKLYGPYTFIDKDGVYVWGTEGSFSDPYLGSYNPFNGCIGMMCNTDAKR